MNTIQPVYHDPEVPYCLLGKVSWGVVQVLKVPEVLAQRYVGLHGWTILIRDSDFPVPLYDRRFVTHSNPRRQADGDDGQDLA